MCVCVCDGAARLHPLPWPQGLRGFYRGFGGILLTVIPANMTYFRQGGHWKRGKGGARARGLLSSW